MAGETYFALPLRDIVLFPGATVPLFIGRPEAGNAALRASEGHQPVLIATQKQSADEHPNQDGLHPFGTLVSVIQVLALPDGTRKVLLETTKRIKLVSFRSIDGAFVARAEVADDKADAAPAALRQLKEAFVDYIVREASDGDHGHAGVMRPSTAAASYLVDAVEDHDIEMSTYKIAALVTLDVPRSAAFIAEPSAAKRIALCSGWIATRIEALYANAKP